MSVGCGSIDAGVIRRATSSASKASSLRESSIGAGAESGRGSDVASLTELADEVRVQLGLAVSSGQLAEAIRDYMRREGLALHLIERCARLPAEPPGRPMTEEERIMVGLERLKKGEAALMRHDGKHEGADGCFVCHPELVKA
jgi:hypothetical protein